MVAIIATGRSVGRVAVRQPSLRAASRSISGSAPSARKALAAAALPSLPSASPSSSTSTSSNFPVVPSLAAHPSSTLPSLSSSSNIANPNNYRCLPSFHSARPFSASATAAVQPNIKLYQYHICPFCNIAKTLLSYSRLEYEAVEVNPLTKAEIRPWSGDYKKVPIALMGEGKQEQVNGSDAILDAILSMSGVRETLEKRWAEDGAGGDDGGDESKMTIQQFKDSENAQKWTAFARDDLASLLYPNICGSLGDSYNAFGYVDGVIAFSAMQRMSIRYLGALAMYFAAGKVKAKRNITDEKVALREALDKFERDGLNDGKLPYASGLPGPDMGDLAVFGVLYSVRGLNAHDEAISSRGGPVREWYDRMHEQVIRKAES